MKKIKLNFKILMLAVIVGFTAATITSCSDDDDGPVVVIVDKATLTAKIAEAKDLLANTEVGKNDGQYSSDSRVALQGKIDFAELVNTEDLSQASVDNTVASLTVAMATYSASVITPIAADALVAYWKFDEGTGTTATDASGNGHDGTFKAGHTVSGAGFPEWTTDRKGNAGKAIVFDDGANVEVPYSLALNPASISISVWIRLDELDKNQRFIGLRAWLGYKFEVQNGNLPFFTVAHSTDYATGPFYDHDAPVSLEIDTWYNLVVTFGGGEMVFYMNGVKIRTWDDTPNPAVTLDTPFNLILGQEYPTDKYSDVDTYGTDWVLPAAWGPSYLTGALDDIRIFNTALTADQVESIYDREK